MVRPVTTAEVLLQQIAGSLEEIKDLLRQDDGQTHEEPADAPAPDVPEEEPAAAPDSDAASPAPDSTSQEPAPAFDPGAHTVAEVNDHLDQSDDDEVERVLAAERDGKARKSILDRS